VFGTVHSRTAPVLIGIDVGSTTVKAVVVDPVTKEILWSDYQRHQTKQPEMVQAFLVRIGNEFPNIKTADIRCFIIGAPPEPVMKVRMSFAAMFGNAAAMRSRNESTNSACLVWWRW
jgi:predicted NBD/HSP70 family sugar kinase